MSKDFRGWDMDPLKVSAQFAAYVWYCQKHEGEADVDREAFLFAQENWIAFLPAAHEEMGQLLLELAALRDAFVRKHPCASARAG
jgi:hypothetical protein